MNKGKTIIVWILIILLLGVIGSCVYRIVDRLNGNTTEPVKTEEKQEEKKNEEQNNKRDEEKEIEDGLTTKDVYEKLNLVLGLNCSLGDLEQFSDDNHFVNVGWTALCNSEKTKLLFSNELSQNAKLAIALSSIKAEYAGDYNASENPSKVKDESVRQKLLDGAQITTIKAQGVKTKYKEIFDEDINSFEDIKGAYGWKNYYYDSVDNIYYVSQYMGGGAGPVNYVLYINNMTQQGNKVYVYMNVAIVTVDNVPISDTSSWDVRVLNDVQALSNFKIDESNYKEFKNYRIVFKKNASDTYSYEKTELVK